MRFSLSETQKANLLEWADVLETTPLHQGFLRLRSGDTYCCLGIYCDMRNPDGWVKGTPVLYSSLTPPFTFLLGKGSPNVEGRLPYKLSLELGFLDTDLHRRFVFLNDNLKYTFPHIAREIRTLVKTGNFSLRTRVRVALRKLWENTL